MYHAGSSGKLSVGIERVDHQIPFWGRRRARDVKFAIFFQHGRPQAVEVAETVWLPGCAAQQKQPGKEKNAPVHRPPFANQLVDTDLKGRAQASFFRTTTCLCIPKTAPIRPTSGAKMHWKSISSTDLKNLRFRGRQPAYCTLKRWVCPSTRTTYTPPGK